MFVLIVSAGVGAVLLPFLLESGGTGNGDTASFAFGGNVVSVTESGRATIQGEGAPMDYNGLLGCRGRYFDADYPDGVPLDFRYSGHDAYLFTGGALYHLGTPIRNAHALHWSENVDGTHVVVTVDCPLPPAALSPVSAAAPPDACSLLTRALAVQTLGRGVGRAEPVTTAPGDTTCIYQTSELTIVSLEVRDAASIETDPLWRSPAVSGLGVPAHAASNPDGLLVVKGGVGIELIVGLGGLGPGGSQAQDTAAELRLARELLAMPRGSSRAPGRPLNQRRRARQDRFRS